MRKTSRTWKSAKIKRGIFRVGLKAEIDPCIHCRVDQVEGVTNTGSCERKSFQRAFRKGHGHVDNRRATDELETLFTGQWSTGKVPHIVFNPEAPPKSYFPDAERWNSSALSADAPTGSHTSGLCQPPVHAIAVRRIWETSRGKEEERVERARRFLKANYPRLFAWHRYLATARDPEGPHHRLGRVRPARLRRDSTRGRLHAAGGAPSAGCARGPEDGRFARAAAGARSPARPARGGAQGLFRHPAGDRVAKGRRDQHAVRCGHHSRRWLA